MKLAASLTRVVRPFVKIPALDVLKFVANHAQRFWQAHVIADVYQESLIAAVHVATVRRIGWTRVETFSGRIGYEKYRDTRPRLDLPRHPE